MKKFKKLISLVVMSTFLLSLAAPAAFAAPVGSDVTDSKVANAVSKLAALGVVTGYADGSVKADQTITRAEFAAVVVRELGLGDASSGVATKFKDVYASHWASGVINLAVGQGIIKGFPDGTFKPDKEVTYAEAVTMLVRMLGYEPAVKGGVWPAVYLSKGASIGVTDGVSINASANAKRGDVFKMASNSLEVDVMEQTGWGTDIKYEVKKDETILTKVFDVEISDEDAAGDAWVVTATPSVAIGDLDADEVDLNDTTYTVKGKIDSNAFLGQEVKIWYNQADKEVFYMEANDGQKVIVDTVDSIAAAGGSIHLDKKDDDYTVKADSEFYVDYKKLDDGADNDIKNEVGALSVDDAYIKIVVDKNDNILFGEIVNYETNKAAIVDEVKGSKINFYDDNVSNKSSLDLDGEDYVIVRNGSVAKISDLKQGDVVNYFQEADGWYVVVTATQAKGKVEKIAYTSSNIDSYDIYVGGKKYDVGDYTTYSDDKNDSIALIDDSDLKDLKGADVTLYLDANGKVKHVLAGATVASSANVGVITADASYDTFDKLYRLELTNQAGQDLSFQFKLDDVTVKVYNAGTKKYVEDTNETSTIDNKIVNNFDLQNDGLAGKLIAVEYKLDSAGKLTEVTKLNLFGPNALNDSQIREDDDVLQLGADYRNVEKSTLIFDAKSALNGTNDEYDDDVKVVTWEGIEDQDTMTVAYTLDDDKVEYLFVLNSNSALGGSKAKYGIVTGFGYDDKTGDDTVLIRDVDDKVTGYIYDNASSHVDKGDVVKYELDANGEIDYADTITNFDDYDQYLGISDSEIESFTFIAKVTDTTSTRIKDATKNIVINSSTKYFDITDDVNVLANGVDEDQMVLAIDTDDDDIAANYVIIIDNDTTDSTNPTP